MSYLHPLFDDFIQTSEQTLFKKKLTGCEFYLKDHRINNVAVLPGVAYLEMARSAGFIFTSQQNIRSLSSVIWAYPFQVINEEKEITISLKPGPQGIAFEVTSLSEEQKKSQLHARGKLITGMPHEIATLSKLDIAAIKSNCIKTKNHDQIYKEFNSLGFHYGPSFQMTTEVNMNEADVISTLKLPSHLENEADKFVLHPCVLDGAIQTAFLLLASLSDARTIYLPFSIGQLDIYAPLPKTCVVYATLTPGSDKTSSPKFQIQVADLEGNVLINIKNFTARVLKLDSPSH